MGGGNRDALKKAIRALRRQYCGNSPVEQALKQLDPRRKRGRPKGTTQYLEINAALLLEAYDLYRYGDPKGAYKPVRTHKALVRTVERHWPECRGGADTIKNAVRRIYKQFRREPLARIVAAPEGVELKGRIAVQDDPDPPSRMWYHRSSFRPSPRPPLISARDLKGKAQLTT
jgi:hypothetical protein